MTKLEHQTAEIIEEVITFRNSRMSYGMISKQLGISKAIVYRIYKNYEDGNFKIFKCRENGIEKEQTKILFSYDRIIPFKQNKDNLLPFRKLDCDNQDECLDAAMECNLIGWKCNPTCNYYVKRKQNYIMPSLKDYVNYDIA